MNKNAIYFLVFISISSVLSSGPTVENIINQFVELKTAAGAQKEDIGVLFAQIKHSVDQSRKAHAHFARAVKLQCQTADAKFGKALGSINRHIGEAKVAIASWTKGLAASTKDRKSASESIKTARKEYEGYENRLARLVIEYKVVAEDAEKKKQVIKLLTDIITDELLKRSGSFVQLTTFQKKLVELKDMLVNNSDNAYAPIVGVLLDLATERGFSDQGVLHKILENLRKLKNALVNFQKSQEAALDSEVDNLKKQLRITLNRIDDYEKIRAQAVSKGLDARHYIGFYNTEIAHLQNQNERKSSEQKLFNKICNFEKNALRSDKKRLRFYDSIYKNFNAKILRLH